MCVDRENTFSMKFMKNFCIGSMGRKKHECGEGVKFYITTGKITYVAWKPVH